MCIYIYIYVYIYIFLCNKTIYQVSSDSKALPFEEYLLARLIVCSEVTDIFVFLHRGSLDLCVLMFQMQRIHIYAVHP